MKIKLPITLIFIIVISYFFALYYFALNVPKWDDFALIKTLTDFQSAHNLFDKWEVLSRQHNEHRILLTRFFTLVDYWIFGELNFVHLMFLGSFALISIFYTFFSVISRYNKDYWIAFCLSIFWFSLAFYENSFWGMASVQNFWIVAFILLIIYFLAYNYKNVFLIFLLAVISVYTSGNGLIVLPLVFFSYLLRKEFRLLKIWVLLSILLAFSYFYHYSTPLDVATSNEFQFNNFVTGLFVLMGSMFEGIPLHSNFILIFGGFLGLGSCFLIFIHLYQHFFGNKELSPFKHFIVLGLCFALSTCVLVSFSRSGISGPYSLLVSRYKLYSALIISLLLIDFSISDQKVNRWAVRYGLVFFSSLCYISYQHYFLKNVLDQRQFLTSITFNWSNLVPENSPKTNAGIYRKPQFNIDQLYTYKQKIPINSQVEQLPADLIFQVELDQLPNDFFLAEAPYLILVNETNCYVVPFIYRRKHSIRNLLNYTSFNANSATCVVNLKETEILPGPYLIKAFIHHRISNLGDRVIRIPEISKVENLSNW